MRVVLQRVRRASVTVAAEVIGRIEQGLLILLGVRETDTPEQARWLAEKIIGLRIFTDADGKMNLGLTDITGSVLVVSQFTLFASTRKGNRPSVIRAAAPEQANQLYQEFCNQLESEVAKPVSRGVFGAHMQIDLVNDGPVTICIDTKRKE